MERANPVTPSPAAEAAAETPAAQPMELLQQATSRAALDALELAIAAAHTDGKLAAVAAQAKVRANEVVHAAEHARRQISALETLARMAALVDNATSPAKGR